MSTRFDLAPRLRPAGLGPDNAAARGWPRALLFVLFVCLLFQGTAVQAHLHLAPATEPSAFETAGPISVGVAGKDEAKAACALCVEAATAGHYLPAGGNALPPPPARVLGVDPQALAEFRLLARAHAWLSRAPPQ
jgi:hypothetical protein